MSIQSFIKSVCVQTAVYWGNPISNGKGGLNYDNPVEIKCRWDDVAEAIKNNNGMEVICRAKVLVTQDLGEQGYLYLGTLDSLYDTVESSAGALPHPRNITGAYAIQRITKVPEIKSTSKFVRTVYL